VKKGLNDPRRGAGRLVTKCTLTRRYNHGDDHSRELMRQPIGVFDDHTPALFEAINGMPAAVARKHYDDRRRRQAQGQAKARAEGRYKGRPEDAKRNEGIARMLEVGQSWGAIQRATGCSRATIAKIASQKRAA
jgi:DNA invertase Pin-like site-specific DNA recombinase